MKKLLKEDINFDKFKYNDIDPHGEEDWDEYEVTNGDIFYIWGTYKNEAIVCIVESEMKNDNLSFSILDSSNKELLKKRISILDRSKSNINSNQFDNTFLQVDENLSFFAIVTERKFAKYYKNIHETMRLYLYENIKKLSGEINQIENEMDYSEQKVINLKKSIKSKNEFPSPKQIKLNKNEYILIRVSKNKTIFNVDFMLTEISEKTDDKGGRNLINTENGQKVIYLLNTYERLVENNYLLVKSKKDDSQTYITNDIEIYVKFVERVIETVNENIHKEVDKNRESYKLNMKKIREKREKLEKEREEYMDFKFSDIVDKLKKMVEK